MPQVYNQEKESHKKLKATSVPKKSVATLVVDKKKTIHALSQATFLRYRQNIQRGKKVTRKRKERKNKRLKSFLQNRLLMREKNSNLIVCDRAVKNDRRQFSTQNPPRKCSSMLSGSNYSPVIAKEAHLLKHWSLGHTVRTAR